MFIQILGAHNIESRDHKCVSLLIDDSLAIEAGSLASSLSLHTSLGMIILFSVIALVLTETTSNTATANMVVPVAIAVCQAAGVDPLQPVLAVCLTASLAFMLPVSTPPNAVVYGSGCVPLLQMVRHGSLLDLASLVAVVATVYWLVPRLVPGLP